jgi:hypothetical protein
LQRTVSMPKELERMIYGFVTTSVVQVADEHGVFSYLIEHGGGSAAQVADAVNVDEDTLERMLLVLVAFGVLHRTQGARYLLPEACRSFLDKQDDRYIGGFIKHLATESAIHVRDLGSFLSRNKGEIPDDARNPFDFTYRSDGSLAAFMDAMWDLSFASSQEIVTMTDLGEVDRLVDIGGASGPFSVAALLAWPRLHAIIFDLPRIEPLAMKRACSHDLEGRLEFVAGNFFSGELPRGDCLAFGYVLSDWPDDTCLELLRKAYRACTAFGRILIMERLFDDDRRGPVSTAVMNLDMHLEMQGRHRSASEYIDLLRATGFTDCEVHRSAGEKHLIVGYKA